MRFLNGCLLKGQIRSSVWNSIHISRFSPFLWIYHSDCPFPIVAFRVAKAALYLENSIHICQIQNNDTPVQSQSERDKTVADNEGGSVRPTAGVQLPWSQREADHLANSFCISGCRGQIEIRL